VARPSAAAIAEPVEEPPGARSRSYTFRGTTKFALKPIGRQPELRRLRLRVDDRTRVAQHRDERRVFFLDLRPVRRPAAGLETHHVELVLHRDRDPSSGPFGRPRRPPRRTLGGCGARSLAIDDRERTVRRFAERIAIDPIEDPREDVLRCGRAALVRVAHSASGDPTRHGRAQSRIGPTVLAPCLGRSRLDGRHGQLGHRDRREAIDPHVLLELADDDAAPEPVSANERRARSARPFNLGVAMGPPSGRPVSRHSLHGARGCYHDRPWNPRHRRQPRRSRSFAGAR
jgi:hypothetical protein